jgi:hypothetical protein
MSHRLPCPNGHVLVIPPKLEGKRIKCPKCQTLMEVPIMTAAEEEEEIITEAAEEESPRPPRRRRVEEEDDEPPRRRRRHVDVDDEDDDEDPPRRRSRRAEEDDDDWDDEPRGRRGREDETSPKAKGKIYRAQMWATRVALLLFTINYYLYALSFLAILVGLLIGVITDSLAYLLLTFYPAGLFSIGIVPILAIIGASFGVRVPPKTHARGLAIALLIMESLSLIGGCSGVSMASSSRMGQPAQVIVQQCFAIFFGISVPLLINTVLLLILLRFLAFHLKDQVTGQDAISFMYLFLGSAIGGFLLTALSFYFFISRPLARHEDPGFGKYIWLVIVVGWLAVIALEMIKVTHILGTVRRRI